MVATLTRQPAKSRKPKTAGSISCPPRFGTPRNPDRETLGHLVDTVAAQMGMELMPHQRLLADVGMEIYPTGEYVYDEVDVELGRQEGKTGFNRVRTVTRLVVIARSLGPQTATYLAQRRQDARKRLEQDFAESLRKAPGFPEVEHPRQRPRGRSEWRLQLNNGNENIEFGNGSRWRIDAPSRTGTHGDTLDDGTIDEAFAHEDDEAEIALRPAMATRRNAQLWVFSAAGDANSKYLYRKVLAGREACETGQHGSVAYFEWSAPDDADPGDPATWRMACPALGYTIDERFLESEWTRACRQGQHAIDAFRRNYLNQWPEVPVLNEADRDQVIPEQQWDECCDPDALVSDPVTFALDVTPDRSAASIAAAGAGGDAIVLEIVDNRPGTRWVVPRVVQLLATHPGSTVVLDKGSAARSLIPDLEAAGITLTIAGMGDHADACSALYDDVVALSVRHLGQPILEAAVAGAVKRTSGTGGLWLWDRTSTSIDISPLVAVTLARWGHVRAASAPPPKRAGYYGAT